MQSCCRIIYRGIFAAFIATLCACQSEFLTYKGKMISEDRRIFIQAGGPHEENLELDKVILDYEYTRHRELFTLSGAVDIRGRKQIWTLTLNVNFADASGIIIGRKDLASAPYKRMTEKLPFEVSFKLPSEAVYMSFSYSGTSSGTGNSGSPSDFWVSP
jgi:hypothetical protein